MDILQEGVGGMARSIKAILFNDKYQEKVYHKMTSMVRVQWEKTPRWHLLMEMDMFIGAESSKVCFEHA